MAEGALKRRIGLGLLSAYGVGVMVGAGIYVLVGAVAAEAGVWAPLAFIAAAIIALPTALSYAEFSTRLPEAAGESAYVAAGFGSTALAVAVGLGIVAAGTLSAAAVLRGGTGYFVSILPMDPQVAAPLIGLALVAVAVVGVLESLVVAAVFTVAELIGLAAVVAAGSIATPSPDWIAAAPPALSGFTAAAILAFFAFIGFEDIVNMAEETVAPERTLPRAILISLVVTTLVYAAVSAAAVRAVPLEDLGSSSRPLALVFAGGGGAALSAIAVVAALNGVLAQIVMAARILFGLGLRASAFRPFRATHPRFGTPARATILVGALVIVGALFFDVSSLAELTSAVLLSVFALVNAALIAVKRQGADAPAFSVPLWVPWSGLVLSAAALAAMVVGGLA